MAERDRIQESISRTSVIWLLVAQLMVLLPLRSVIPLPIIGIALFCAGWRLILWYGRGIWPTLWLRLILMVTVGVAIVVSFQPLITLESMVSILAAAYSLKLLEMRYRRDALVVVYIGFFVVTTSVLFSQSLLQAAYLLLCLVVLIAAQQGLYRREAFLPVVGSLRYGVVLVLQAVPLTAVLFILVPRLDPLWSVPQPDYSATTGVSDTMAPGDIARLSQSDELAFRAVFDGALPPANERYWRMVVLDQFDGRSWYQTSTTQLLQKSVPVSRWQQGWRQPQAWWATQETGYKYEVLLEATGQPWLVTLGPAAVSQGRYLLMRTMRLQAASQLYERQVYSVTGSMPVSQKKLPNWLKTHNLQLPRGNPQARRTARRWMLQVSGHPEQLADHIMRYFQEQGFVYTLSPPLMAGESIDRFLFTERQGFCAHYAGAFVFMMRAAGVPARVVSGYQGGEVKPEQNMIQVRQFDAHAWAEIWVNDKGWIRYDPTAAIAPDRITGDLETVLGLDGGFLNEQPLSLLRYRQVPMLNQWRLFYENLEYRWQRTVIDYQREQQQALLKQWLGTDSLQWRQISALIAIVLLVLGCSSLLLLYRRDRSDPLGKIYQSYLHRLQRYGVYPENGEGESSLLRRIEDKYPELADSAGAFTSEYIRCRYGVNQGITARDFRLLQRLIKEIIAVRR